jgi:hypothetical protein
MVDFIVNLELISKTPKIGQGKGLTKKSRFVEHDC